MHESHRESDANDGFATAPKMGGDTQCFRNAPHNLFNVRLQAHMRSFCRYINFKMNASVHVKHAAFAVFGVLPSRIGGDAMKNDEYNLECGT